MKDKEKRFKERIDCGIAYCEDTPNNQIEEIADILCESKNRNCNGGENCKCLEQAKKTLYEQGYRKIDKDKDSVVLSREEYENNLTLSIGYKIGSKETAEKIFDTIIKALEERKERVKAFYGIAESVGADVAIRTIKELAKQFGVEIKE